MVHRGFLRRMSFFCFVVLSILVRFLLLIFVYDQIALLYHQQKYIFHYYTLIFLLQLESLPQSKPGVV